MEISLNAPLHATSAWETPPYEYASDDPGCRIHPPAWELIADPSDSMLLGGRFHMKEIIQEFPTSETRKRGILVWDCWTPGMRFRNIHTGKAIEIYRKRYLVYTSRYKRATVERFNLSLRYLDKPDGQLELDMRYNHYVPIVQ